MVSHSRVLAEAAVALAAEMLQGAESRTAVAAGLDDTTFGTDAVAIAEAIALLDGPAGVVVLMDLGSAVLSAELALELLPDPDAAGRVLLCPAPLVEGLIVATVSAAGGASRAEVAAEAAGALAGKRAQLGEVDAPTGGGSAAGATGPPGSGAAPSSGRFTVDAPHGLHARPAAALVALLRAHDAQVELSNVTTGAGPVSAASLSRLTTLGALDGHEVEVRATGPDADAAVRAALEFAARHFDEAPGAGRPAATTGAGGRPAAPSAGAPDGGAGGPAAPAPGAPLPASPGVGIGPVWRRSAAAPTPDATPAGDPAAERTRLDDAIAVAEREVTRTRIATAAELGEQDAAIFDAHLALLADPALVEDAYAAVAGGASAGIAWAGAVDATHDGLAALDDPYLRARAADVRAVGDQVLRALAGEAAVLTGSGVLVAPDLTPGEAASLDPTAVTGIVLAYGSLTSHAAILARARGIPAVVAAGAQVLDLADGTTIALDGTTGELLVDPSDDVLAEWGARAEAAAATASRQLAAATASASTSDGHAVVVAANLGSLDDAREAQARGADGAGLVRTEFLFLERDDAPTVEEQVDVYSSLAQALGGKRITLRTLDVGGDKPLRYVPMPPEDNPFLGVRGLRLTLARPELMRDQLMAMCLVARETPVSIMFPMVTTVAELFQARGALDEAAAATGGTPAGLEVGIMVEVPGAALKAATFVRHVDFFSIGTNDLTQYTLAADRGNTALSSLADPLDPGVLSLIGAVCQAAAGRVPVAVCGESAADPVAVPLLLGSGVTELSVSPRAVPAVKDAVRRTSVAQESERAAAARRLPTAADVRSFRR